MHVCVCVCVRVCVYIYKFVDASCFLGFDKSSNKTTRRWLRTWFELAIWLEYRSNYDRPNVLLHTRMYSLLLYIYICIYLCACVLTISRLNAHIFSEFLPSTNENTRWNEIKDSKARFSGISIYHRAFTLPKWILSWIMLVGYIYICFMNSF